MSKKMNKNEELKTEDHVVNVSKLSPQIMTRLAQSLNKDSSEEDELLLDFEPNQVEYAIVGLYSKIDSMMDKLDKISRNLSTLESLLIGNDKLATWKKTLEKSK